MSARGSATSSVLVIGGTGPTGVPLVEDLLADDRPVTILHSGHHEVTFSRPVEHLHADAGNREPIRAAVSDRSWDAVISTSGKLQEVAAALQGRTARLVGVTGTPVYAGSMQALQTGRLELPVPEDADRQRGQGGYAARIADVEDFVFDLAARGAYEAAIVRYPGIYGPRAPLNNEWTVVKHCLDRRPFIVVADGGTSYFHRAYAANAARMLRLAAWHPNAAGQAFNAGDEAVLCAAEIVAITADEIGVPLDLVPVPAPLCRGIFPLADRASQILDISKARNLLGYRDALGVAEATRLTVRWLADHEPDLADRRAGGPPALDYDREDRLKNWWDDACLGLAPLGITAGQ